VASIGGPATPCLFFFDASLPSRLPRGFFPWRGFASPFFVAYIPCSGASAAGANPDVLWPGVCSLTYMCHVRLRRSCVPPQWRVNPTCWAHYFFFILDFLPRGPGRVVCYCFRDGRDFLTPPRTSLFSVWALKSTELSSIFLTCVPQRCSPRRQIIRLLSSFRLERRPLRTGQGFANLLLDFVPSGDPPLCSLMSGCSRILVKPCPLFLSIVESCFFQG